jgi:hypothetical protein
MTEMRRRLRGAGGPACTVLVALVCAALPAAGLGAAVPQARDRPGSASLLGKLGPNGGYIWHGETHAVAGSWTVPRPLRHASGSGDMLIAAEGEADSKGEQPFIELGTHEQVPGAGKDDIAWWSDLAHDFAPQRLFAVSPGDRLTARMTLVDHVWHLEMRDLSTHRTAHATADAGDATYDQAQWLLERDEDILGDPTPYARTTVARFGDMLANGERPSYADLYGYWMSENGQALAPTAPVQGSFALRRGFLSRPAVLYLRLAAGVNEAADVFYEKAANWTDATPTATIAPAARAFASALETFEQGLERGPWPAAAQEPVAAQEPTVRRIRRYVLQGINLPAGSESKWVKTVLRISGPVGPEGHFVRRAVGAPDAS